MWKAGDLMDGAFLLLEAFFQTDAMTSVSFTVFQHWGGLVPLGCALIPGANGSSCNTRTWNLQYSYGFCHSQVAVQSESHVTWEPVDSGLLSPRDTWHLQLTHGVLFLRAGLYLGASPLACDFLNDFS